MIRKAKPIVSGPYQNEFLDIIRILTEEVWKESKRSSSIHTDDQPKPECISPVKIIEKPSLNSTKFTQGKPQSPLNLSSPLFTKKYNFTTTPLNRSGSESFFSTPKYKNQVSQDVAYMSTFSFYSFLDVF
ncbi:hypothetical protein SteCoe_24065 [Stentor coeruleus]|uniref:Uncharacterized protein n=1 Tax=Stentor coeruleus TaxID=5963 RepID=A0A1R2BIK5_9CILI|nr:hypothetical protein SteCoe_24065 [Stentor coeruleus]